MTQYFKCGMSLLLGRGGGGIKIPWQDFALKMLGGGGEEGAYVRGGAYLWDTMVIPVSMSTTTYYATSVEDVVTVQL